MYSVELPKVSAPLANYLSFTQTGHLVFISGQLPLEGGELQYAGRLGESLSVEKGKQAASLCLLNVLAQLKLAIGSFDRVKQCVKMTGFINATPDFTDHAAVLNGASDLLVTVLGEKGKHARAALGVASLPLGAAVEVEAIFEVD